MRPIFALLAGLVLLSVSSTADAADTIAIIPQPTNATPRTGQFTVPEHTVIWTDPASAALGRQLARYLEPATGFPLRVVSTAAAPRNSIALHRDPSLSRLGAEGYLLDVTPAHIVARAPEAAG